MIRTKHIPFSLAFCEEIDAISGKHTNEKIKNETELTNINLLNKDLVIKTSHKNNHDSRKEIELGLRYFFHKYDLNNSKTIDESELPLLLKDIGESNCFKFINTRELFKTIDKDDSGNIDFDEFQNFMIEYYFCKF